MKPAQPAMTADLRPYPEYKDSGLPWLGAVPSRWDVRRNGRLFAQRNETGFGDLPILEVSLKTGVRVRDFDNSKRKQVMSDRVKYKRAVKGDIAYNMMRLWQGAVGTAPVGGLVSPAYVVARPFAEVDSRYYAYLFRTDAYMNEVNKYSRGIVSDRNRLYWDDFKQMPSPFPPTNEQRAIADFLDHHGRAVRRFLRNRRRLIEVLNEQKQAIIDQYVTGKLDPRTGRPYPRYKPSGIDWLGDVPEHWEVRRLKYLVQNINEQTSSLRDGEIYVALEHVESWTGRLALPNGEATFDSQVKRFREGDILFGKLRPYLAKVTRPQQAGVCVGEFLVLRPSDTTILPRFLEQKLRSKQIIDLVNSSTFGAKMPRVDWTFISNFQIAFPPKHDEQAMILERIAR
jgi:type I restriction enzyme S subunit